MPLRSVAGAASIGIVARRHTSPFAGFSLGLHCVGAVVLAVLFFFLSVLGCHDDCGSGGGWQHDPANGRWRLMTWAAVILFCAAPVFCAVLAAGVRTLAVVVHAVELGAVAVLLWLALSGADYASRTEWGLGVLIAGGEALALVSFVQTEPHGE